MLDEILGKKEVKRIIENIKYVNLKDDKQTFNYKLFNNQSKVLFMFYKALFDYKILINDKEYLDDYLEQIDKLLKKMNNLDDLGLGINKLIYKFTCRKLGIRNGKEEENREEILQYFYDKYIINGYFFHGFNSIYKESIERYGLTPEEYVNYYEDFKKINEIFHKYNITNILDKDFTEKEIYFTDNFVKSCIFSANAPGYFYNLLYKSDYNYLKLKKDILLKGNYEDALKNLKRILSFLEINEEDKNYIIEVFKKEWKLIFLEDRQITLLAVKRNMFLDSNGVNLEKIMNDKSIDLYEAVDKILCERNSKIICREMLDGKDMQIINLEGLWLKSIDDDKKLKKLDAANDFRNIYGNVSIIILVGAMLISLGVIISIVIMIGG